ncbi:MAG: S41 family peptidase, partial [Gammaproteobacteria bacterium]
PLHNDRALKLTTARYYTPKGRSIQATGIIPDITVETATITRVDTSSDRFREADLRGHLSNQFSDEERKGDISAKETPSLAEKDYQLFQALSLLKGLKAISSI